MAEHVVRFEQFFAAPPEAVFAWLAEHENVGKLFPGRTRRIQDAPEGHHVNGIGSAREIRLPLMSIVETITRFEPPSLIEYRVTQGWPIHNHVGRIKLEADSGGTQLEYLIEFDSRLPFAGALLATSLCRYWRRGIHKAIEDISAHTPTPHTSA